MDFRGFHAREVRNARLIGGALAALPACLLLITASGSDHVTSNTVASALGATSANTTALMTVVCFLICALYLLGPGWVVIRLLFLSLLITELTAGAAVIAMGLQTPTALMWHVVPVVAAAFGLYRAGAITISAVAMITAFAQSMLASGHSGGAANGITTVATLITLSVALVFSREAETTLRAKLDELSQFDTLTGLTTRKFLRELVENDLAHVPNIETPRWLVLIDVDHFKALNDRHGHPAGDAALISIADLIKSSAPAGSLNARIGGDEFAMVLPEQSWEDTAELLDSLVVGVGECTAAGAQLSTPLSLSIGAAPFTPGATYEGLYRRADCALYEAKAKGRNGWKLAAAVAS